MSKQFLFELGCEELPALDLIKATKQFKELIVAALKDQRLHYSELKVDSTPRRIVAQIQGLEDTSEELAQRFRGPQVQAAFDTSGNPTKAALGFARGKGVEVSELERAFEGEKEYVFANTKLPARDAADILSEVFPKAVSDISWPRSQKWGSTSATFARPIRWVLALLDKDVVGMEIADLHSSNISYGNRLIAPEAFEVVSPENYEELLEEHFVVLSFDRRVQLIKEQVANLEKREGLVADLPEHTFNEVVNLVEWPTVMLAHFDEEFLAIPHEIITDAMLEHQRYFPLYDTEENLSNKFIVTSNGNPKFESTIVEGNERVVRARLSDAAFFFEEDSKLALEDYLPKLNKLAFHEKLGTVLGKVERMQDIVSELSGVFNDEKLSQDASRAAKLAKADLVTSAVVEFTSLQGIMGGYYAKIHGENDEVAQAISEHYRPRFAGDVLPQNRAGKLVALADKLDTVVGIFAAHQGPTGSSDPFAVRRSAIGIINILTELPELSLEEALKAGINTYVKQDIIEINPTELLDELADFFTTRMSVMAKDNGINTDSIHAVSNALGSTILDPLDFFARAHALDSARLSDEASFENLAQAYTRAKNLSDPSLGVKLNTELFSPVEQKLYNSLGELEGKLASLIKEKDYKSAFAELAKLKDPIDNFFTEVLVMDENQELRENHLRLLNAFTQVFEGIADFSELNTK